MNEFKALLDYGCGKATLDLALPEIAVTNYDPCLEIYAERPEPHEFVVCTDVLEHVEPECLEFVLDDIRRLTKKMLFMSVATRPAKKVLSDGRNAHLIQQDMRWWLPRIWKRFDIFNLVNISNKEFVIIACPR